MGTASPIVQLNAETENPVGEALAELAGQGIPFLADCSGNPEETRFASDGSRMATAEALPGRPHPIVEVLEDGSTPALPSTIAYWEVRRNATIALGMKAARATPAFDKTQPIRVWTDGSALGNPGPGGWGCIIRQGDLVQEHSGNAEHTTNNQMELMAAIHALMVLPEDSTVELHTDAEYLVKGMSEWLGNWKRNGWRTSSGKPVMNKDLWAELERASKRHRHAKWIWVKGHAGDGDNTRADQLAVAAAKAVAPHAIPA
jgi:ribonuclease HI